MTDLTTAMVRQSLDAFVNMDANEARRVCRLDDEVDRLNSEIIQELIDQMQESPAIVQAGSPLCRMYSSCTETPSRCDTSSAEPS